MIINLSEQVLARTKTTLRYALVLMIGITLGVYTTSLFLLSGTTARTESQEESVSAILDLVKDSRLADTITTQQEEWQYEDIAPVAIDQKKYLQLGSNTEKPKLISSIYPDNITVRKLDQKPVHLIPTEFPYEAHHGYDNLYYEISSVDGFSAHMRIGTNNLKLHDHYFDIFYEPFSAKFYQLDEGADSPTLIQPPRASMIPKNLDGYYFEGSSDAGHGKDTYFIVSGDAGIEITIWYGPGSGDYELKQDEFIKEIMTMLSNLKIEDVILRG